MPFVCIGGKRAGWLQKSIVGQVIRFHGQYDLTIVGVAKEAPVTSSLQFDALVPFTFEERQNSSAQAWDVNGYFTYVVLDAHVRWVYDLKKPIPPDRNLLTYAPVDLKLNEILTV